MTIRQQVQKMSLLKTVDDEGVGPSDRDIAHVNSSIGLGMVVNGERGEDDSAEDDSAED